MVSLSDIQSSNAQVSALPPGLVAVFVGATNGIGEYSLKEFARRAQKPRVYFVGRSQEAAGRIREECRELNPEGEFIFIKAEVNTSEGLHIFMALAYYARARFIVNLLPLIHQAPGLRRVVTVLAAGHEGSMHTDDFQSRNLPFASMRAHMVSMTDMMLECMAQRAPEVSFVHDFPGQVKSGFGRETNGVLMRIAMTVFKIIGPLVFMPTRECGERHLFFATSSRYPPRPGAETDGTAGVPMPTGVPVATGTNGKEGSGVYAINWDGESAGPKSLKVLWDLRDEDMVKQVWEHTVAEFKRITGLESLDEDE